MSTAYRLKGAALRFRLWGWLSGVALVKAAQAASDADDAHEAIHCMAAWHVGQSDHCTPQHHICSLDAPLITSAQHGRGILPDDERDAELAGPSDDAITDVVGRVLAARAAGVTDPDEYVAAVRRGLAWPRTTA